VGILRSGFVPAGREWGQELSFVVVAVPALIRRVNVPHTIKPSGHEVPWRCTPSLRLAR
jgi:hypothetical protein